MLAGTGVLVSETAHTLAAISTGIIATGITCGSLFVIFLAWLAFAVVRCMAADWRDRRHPEEPRARAHARTCAARRGEPVPSLRFKIPARTEPLSEPASEPEPVKIRPAWPDAGGWSGFRP